MLVGQFGHGRGEMRGTRLQSMVVAALNLSRREVALQFLSMLPGQISFMASQCSGYPRISTRSIAIFVLVSWSMEY